MDAIHSDRNEFIRAITIFISIFSICSMPAPYVMNRDNSQLWHLHATRWEKTDFLLWFVPYYEILCDDFKYKRKQMLANARFVRIVIIIRIFGISYRSISCTMYMMSEHTEYFPTKCNTKTQHQSLVCNSQTHNYNRLTHANTRWKDENSIGKSWGKRLSHIVFIAVPYFIINIEQRVFYTHDIQCIVQCNGKFNFSLQRSFAQHRRKFSIFILI